MTDAEIMDFWKAVKKASSDRQAEGLSNDDAELHMSGKYALATLDLLNRKDAEIERLKKLALARHLHIEHLNADIRELKETRYSQVKAEAYKDLAEKLKAKKKRAYFESEGFYWCVTVEDIDEVLKEVSE